MARGVVSAFISLCLLLVVLPATGKSRHAYPFADDAAYLAPAQEFESWYEVVARQQSQRDALLACASEPKRCRRGRLRSFHRVMERSRDLSRREQVELVNYYINRNRYDEDFPRRIYDENGRRIGSIRNHWTTLYDFLASDGDCEDYATSKYFMLREMGFEAQNLRVVIVYSRELRGYHAVVAVRLDDDEVWLLDSDNRIRKGSHREYRYVYALNEDSVWDHRDDYRRSP